MIIKPFRGWRPRPDLSTKIPSYPYDVVNSAEAREIAGNDPHSFLHVVRPEIDLDPGMDPFDSRVYLKGRENLHGMMEDGRLVRDEQPAYYVYQLRMEEHVQTGIVGASAVDDYLADRIKKHEFTRPDKEQDRIRLVDTLGAHPGPVFLTYRGLPELTALVRGVTSGDATVRFTATDGIEHALWVVDEPESRGKIESLFAKIPASYVADGHHRAAAAAAVSARRREARPDGGADAPANYFLTVLFPSSELKVLDYNRVVTDLNGMAPADLIERIREAGFDVEPGHSPRRPPHRQTFGMYLDGSWHLLTAGAHLASTRDVVESLDVAILTRHLLQPVLGIGDPRTDKRIDFIGGIRGMDELERRVESGDSAIAFSLYPTSLEQVMDVADAGKVMPPKSTWFEPKLRSGMVIQDLDGDTL